MICCDCARKLTAAEEHYYEHRCETCERDLLERMDAWRHGVEDVALDRMYGAPRPARVLQ